MKTTPPRLALLAIAVLLAATAAHAASPYDIELASRTFEPTPALRSNQEDVHVVIQFRDIPSLSEREELVSRGITLLDYVPNYAWTASAKAGALAALDASRVRAIFTLAPDDKISRRAEGWTTVRAFVYRDVVDAEAVLARYGAITEVVGAVYTIELSGDVRALAAEDIVKFVDGPLPEKVADNDDIRDNINADEVQTSPYNMHGTGIYAAMWDDGAVSTSHNDFSGRLTVADGSGTGSHPTACAGMLAGDGSRSTAYGGSPYQWRGVADDCNLASYSWPDDIPNMDTETSHAISNYDIVVSSNSWSWGLCPDYCYYYGTYDDYSQNYDKIVTGSQGKRLTVVFSAGNDRDCSDCSGDLPDFPYGTIPGPGSTAKNTICVGSNNADNDALSWYSSTGPTLDGRTKPDIVAPGCKSSAGITTTNTSNGYSSGGCGTSYSCPVVSGCVVLTQEDYMDKFGGEAWPSTVKALLIQGAEDLGNTGPDFEFGFGRVHIQNTIDIIRTDDGTGDYIMEESISTGQTWTHTVDVSGESEITVTLVWDDYFGSYEGSGKRLVNDLDLEIVSPSMTTYYPWHLDPNNPGNNATTGVDDLNNVEQVIVNSPASGTWTVRVIATTLPQPDQDFSLVTNVAPGGGDPPPAAPTGLDATAGSGDGEVDIDWNDNTEPDFDHYRLERADNPSFVGSSSFITGTSDYVDSGLTPGDTYYYRAYAVDAGSNESGASNTDSSPAADLPPAAPTGLNATPGSGEGEIDVDWNDNSEPDLNHYRLQRAANPSFSGAVSFTPSASNYTDSGLTPGDTYYYRVYAVDDGSNESGQSGADSAVATDLPPARPNNLYANPGAGEGEIDVDWDDNTESDFDHYRLERATNSSFTGAVSFSPVASSSYADSGLMPGLEYYYRAYAVDEGGNESIASLYESAVATDLPPAAPTGLVAASGVGEGEIDLDWDDNSEIDLSHYRVERADNPSFSGSSSFTTGSSDYADSGLTPGDIYYYRVFAVDNFPQESTPSGMAFADATDLPPATPTGLAATSGAGEGEIDLDWDDNGEGDLDHYRIERADNPGFVDPASFTTTASAHLDGMLTNGRTYYYRVYAVDERDNESSASASDWAVATDLVPSAPTGLALVPGPHEGEIFVSWSVNPESDIGRYRLERSLAPDFEPGSEPFEEPAVSYQDSGLIPGALYYYRVYAIDANENVSPPSSVESDYALDLAPAAPIGLAAMPGVGEGEIDLDWEDNVEGDFDHYRLERADNPSFSGATPFITSSSDYADTGLTPGDLYYYRVFAYDANSNVSDASGMDSEFATDLPPAAPTGLALVPGPAEGDIFVNWSVSPEPDLDRYRLERSLAPDFEPGSEPFEGAVASYQDSGLTPGDLYYYRVYAIDDGENVSPPSLIESDYALDLFPAAPTGLVAVTGGAEGEIAVDWDDNGEIDLDHYRLERADNVDFIGADLFATGSSDHADSGLTPGQTYYYRAYAVDANTNVSPVSDYDWAIAADDPPAAPTGLVVTPGPGEGEIEVSWSANTEPDFDRYRLERHTDPAFGPGSDPFEQHVTYFPDSGLVPGDEYFYRVIAIDLGGNESAPSSVESAIALDLIPSPPMNLAATPGAGEGEIDVDWDDNGEIDLDHYRLERADNPGFAGSAFFTAPTSDYADSGLTPGQTYYYRSYAVDANSNESDESDWDSAVATDAAPAAPTGLAADDGPGDGEIELAWHPNTEPDFNRYRLERDTVPEFTAPVGFETTDPYYLDSGLEIAVTYYYRLWAIDDSDNVSPPGDTVEHMLAGTDVPEDLVASVSFVRPNPFTEQASIAYAVPAAGARVAMRIYDIKGRLVTTLIDSDHAGGVYEATWNGRDANGVNAASGIYFCRAEISGLTEIRKVVLLR